MAEWYHGFNGREFEQTQGDSEGQGSLVCCSSWGHRELDMTTQQQYQLEYKNSLKEIITIYFSYISPYLSLSFYLIYAQQSMVIAVLIA